MIFFIASGNENKIMITTTKKQKKPNYILISMFPTKFCIQLIFIYNSLGDSRTTRSFGSVGNKTEEITQENVFISFSYCFRANARIFHKQFFTRTVSKPK